LRLFEARRPPPPKPNWPAICFIILRASKSRKGKKGKGRSTGQARPRGGLPALPDLSKMPPGLNELPPGLAGLDQLPAGFDPSRLKLPKSK
jgi:signal recognition particle subunit SRP54